MGKFHSAHIPMRALSQSYYSVPVILFRRTDLTVAVAGHTVRPVRSPLVALGHLRPMRSGRQLLALHRRLRAPTYLSHELANILHVIHISIGL